MKWFLLGWMLSRFFAFDVDSVDRAAVLKARSAPAVDSGRVKVMDGNGGTPPTGH
jgi:hypothetical protein